MLARRNRFARHSPSTGDASTLIHPEPLRRRQSHPCLFMKIEPINCTGMNARQHVPVLILAEPDEALLLGVFVMTYDDAGIHPFRRLWAIIYNVG